MQHRPISQAKSWSYAFFAQIVWGTGGVVIKLINKSLPGSLLVGLRHGIGSLVLGAHIVKNKREAVKNLPRKHLIAMGILAAFPDLLLVGAVRRVGAIIAILVIRLEIPLVVIFAHIFLKEKIGLNAYLAAALSLLGACLISIKPGQALTLHNGFYVGVVMAFGGAILWALSGVYAKFLLNRQTDPLGMTFVRLSVGSIFMLATSLVIVHNPLQVLQNLALKDWVWIIYLGVFLSAVGYLMFYKAMTVIDVHIISILLSVSIAVLLILGLIIGEHISSVQWLGIAFIALGIYLVRPKEPSVADD